MNEFDSGGTIVIFVQAAADAGYAFAICERAARQKTPVLIIVILVRSLYEYLIDIPLANVEIHFVPYLLQPMPRLPWTLIRAHRQLSSFYSSIFKGRLVAEVWFFCVQWDAVTPYFLRRLSATAPIYLADHYQMPEVRETRWPVRLAVKWLFLRMATGVSFDFCRETVATSSEKVWRTTFDESIFGAKKIELAPRWACLPLPAGSHRPAVVFMDSNDELSQGMSGYKAVVSALLAGFDARNIDVFLKFHPRVGGSSFLGKFNLPSLPAGCPLELFDLSGVIAVIALNSLGLAAVAKLGYTAVSLLYLMEFDEEAKRTFWRSWLDRHSDGKILFPQSASEVFSVIVGVTN